MTNLPDKRVLPSGERTFLFKYGTSPAEMDIALWSAYRAGNREALDLILEKHTRLLLAYGSRITKDHFLIEDCIQDIFVELWYKREVIGDTDNIKLYLLKSLRRKIIRALSIKNRLHVQSLDVDYEDELEFSAEFNLIQNEVVNDRRKQLKDGLAQLSKRQREAVYLKFYEHFDYNEISEAMNLTVKSTYKLIGKAIETLRKVIKS
ncbi:RNA polymerase sigma factor [Pseudochryseolinea flava]|uniref:RNA polymerase subunit sigma n=1 Tax=Pseudochryseolinea flava TaxID=2059302 RepID=A0A364XYA6_9BACT|nr:sigma-70 family RNA polymerase sigma factor [Pseudochryseolinea flava]RAV99244.1 RNA polymerase subunit sigma [Pseudochryseolinea flava]